MFNQYKIFIFLHSKTNLLPCDFIWQENPILRFDWMLNQVEFFKLYFVSHFLFHIHTHTYWVYCIFTTYIQCLYLPVLSYQYMKFIDFQCFRTFKQLNKYMEIKVEDFKQTEQTQATFLFFGFFFFCHNFHNKICLSIQ